MTLQTERLRTVEQIRGFLDATGQVDFRPQDREEAYGFVRRTLVRLDYDALGRSGKGTVREFLGKATGLSRAQVTRLIGQHRATGRVEDRRAANSGRSFERVYTPTDIRLLAEADEIGGQLCGPAACEVMRQQYEVFGDAGFERLSRLSVSHLYNLRRSKTYRARRTTIDHTRPTTGGSTSADGRIPPASPATCAWTRCTRGLRPRWRPQRREGRLRHQPDRRSHPVRACRRRDGDRRDVPRPGAGGDARHAAVRRPRLPRRQRVAQRRAGSEYVNRQVAGLLNKLHVPNFTKSRARRSNDNALVEGKNASVVRKWLGHDHIPQRFAPEVNADRLRSAFAQGVPTPYLNYHHPCLFATEVRDGKGKVRRRYRRSDVTTPYEKLKSLPGAERFLKPGVTFAALDETAYAVSDLEANRRANHARDELFRTIGRAIPTAA